MSCWPKSETGVQLSLMGDAHEFPAIFMDKDRVYKADSCDPVKVAVENGEMRNVALVHGAYPGTKLAPRCLPEISCVGYWDIRRDQSWGLGEHRNEGLEISYLSRGRLAASVDGHAYQQRAGTVSITRPWQVHTWGDPHVTSCRHHYLILDVGVRRPDQEWRWPKWLALSPDDVKRMTTLLRHNEQPFWTKAEEIGDVFERMSTVVDGWKSSPRESRLRLSVNELLVAILEMLERRDIPLDDTLSSSMRTVELFLAALPEHVSHPWDLDLMAEQCGLARSRFAYYCKRIVNVTPLEFLVRCRVQMASRLLLQKPALKLTDVAAQCGFQSTQYFSTVFKAHSGKTPREFQGRP